MSEVYKTDSVELRQGRWQDCLADVECDALITDTPYSERTHDGLQGRKGLDPRYSPDACLTRAAVKYDGWTADNVHEFVAHWAPRTRSWFATITDHVLGPAWEAALLAAGKYVFQPLPFLEMGKQPRLNGDGPASWTCWIYVARPKERRFGSWGSLPGGYVPPPFEHGSHGGRFVKGGKPMWLMQSLIRDYTRPGDLVCDPCAGGGTTLLAAATEGRRAIGAECMPEHFEIARKRLSKGFTRSMFSDVERKPAPVQVSLLDDGDDK
jgi:hypothetical protein